MTANEKYAIYEKLLAEWNQKINLVARGTLPNIRQRHIDDSAQLANYIPKTKTVIDMGSGAGFPAAVLAILGLQVIAIESIGKKCRFLEDLKIKLDLPNLAIINDRVENAVPKILQNAKKCENDGQKSPDFVFTARAFAPLIKILDLTKKYNIPYVLLKGQGAMDEIAQARRKYSFQANMHPSETGDGYIINLTTI
jgi:16S rRNA (guanine527-N7)-methyltransferase